MQPVASFPDIQIYSYAFNGRWAREIIGGWTQIKLSILKFLDFKIKISSVNVNEGSISCGGDVYDRAEASHAI